MTNTILDLLALFECEHISRNSKIDKVVLQKLNEISPRRIFVSRTQRKRFKENLKWMDTHHVATFPRFLYLLLTNDSEKHIDGDSRRSAEVLVKLGFHYDEYLELCGGVVKYLRNHSAKFAIVCSGHVFDVHSLEKKLRRKGINVKSEEISFGKFLLAKEG